MEIKPVEVIDGVPVFKPSMMEFANFQYFIDEITKLGLENGIVKVIPPKEWLDLLEGTPSVESLKSIRINSPIHQNVKRWDRQGNDIFTIGSSHGNESYNLMQWKNLFAKSGSRINQSSQGDESLEENYNLDNQQDYYDLTRLQALETDFWKSVAFSKPLYGVDENSSIFPYDLTLWNLNNLSDSISSSNGHLLFGQSKSTFPWHLDEQNKCSVHYLHFGGPKQWYSIPCSSTDQFLDFLSKDLPTDKKNCPAFMSHQNILTSPDFLKEHDIKFNRVPQFQHEFIITFPYSAYSGFDYSYNLCESTEFLLDRQTVLRKQPLKCLCGPKKEEEKTGAFSNLSYDSNESEQRESINDNDNDNDLFQKVRSFDELLNHSSQELQNLEDNKNPLFSNINMTRPQSSSLRSTTPTGVNQFLNMNQTTISRISSPLLSRMMDLSNIVEPTLDVPTSKFKRKVLTPQLPQMNIPSNSSNFGTPSLTNTNSLLSNITATSTNPSTLTNGNQNYNNSNNNNDDDDNNNNNNNNISNNNNNSNNNDNNSNGVANATAAIAATNNTTGANSTTNNSSNNNISTVPSSMMHSSTLNGSSGLGGDNDDNMLALSLATLANSATASPRLTLPPLSSPMNSNGNIAFNGNSSNGNNSYSNGAAVATGAATSAPHSLPIVSPNPTYSPNPLSLYLTNSKNPLNSGLAPLSPSTSNIPFLKRNNVVTLNISREASKSPISSFVNDYRSPLGVSNPLMYSSTINDYSNGTGIRQNSNNINPLDAGPSFSPLHKKPKILSGDDNSNNNSNFDYSFTGNKQEPTSAILNDNTNNDDNYRNSSMNNNGIGYHSHSSKFGENEVIMSDHGKIYICRECNRQFSSGHHLTRHKKSVHSGEKPHSCPRCGKRFKRRDHVLQHLNKKIPCTQEMENAKVAES
ncbi:histone demethylase GIS1 SKDI_04G3230 [Saccharomyces kudriavzevii IFO 1802]|uniref:GIS1-like protein n=2 Tax=Saccharomyces kudriavzevii (strain ATCC MYA-4449 / AS 2.2408 / CBS 8840 / NBRC 1802 / NCYC 2889) TaxID=226230 RepID=J4TX84_SACK1|nr:uncharacterized protein SKDI_04G3230 [Saccharomyces kudriavzevii IFO 1802]EJT42770.1 GIS1-like protein [Saccharomyces kudriavzevii IFO 1802]CAI4058125.1 hypothetical protein SKDI_04G3230 [Saccharomyces kudriavzevii IFO 1802]